MPKSNHVLAYTLLRGGIAVQNPIIRKYGTIGFVATSDGTDRWIVSCYHVLCRPKGTTMPAGVSEPICQPHDMIRDTPVAFVSADRADEALDCAAALVPNGQAVDTILGIGKLSAPADAELGMRVIKSGAETGVTEGTVTGIGPDEIEISTLGLPEGFDLTTGRDSGALWVSAKDNAPIGLHYRGNEDGTRERAFARPIKLVLAKLRLDVVRP